MWLEEEAGTCVQHVTGQELVHVCAIPPTQEPHAVAPCSGFLHWLAGACACLLAVCSFLCRTEASMTAGLNSPISSLSSVIILAILTNHTVLLVSPVLPVLLHCAVLPA